MEHYMKQHHVYLLDDVTVFSMNLCDGPQLSHSTKHLIDLHRQRVVSVLMKTQLTLPIYYSIFNKTRVHFPESSKGEVTIFFIY